MSRRIVELAHERRRFGYRRIGDLIRAEGTAINDKRVYRLYRLADLAVRKRRGRKRLKLERVPLQECHAINEVWSMDFVSDCLASGRRIKCLTVAAEVILTPCAEVRVTHLGKDDGLFGAVDVDPGAGSGDTSDGPKGRGGQIDREADGLLAQHGTALPA